MEVHERLSEEFPSYRANLLRIDEFTERSLRTGEAQRAMRKLITIPVVVHVVYNEAAENISRSQINSQITVLNRDYRATNPDKSSVPGPWQSLVGDSKVEFKLASRDPKGKQTDGITRTHTSRTSFGADDSVKKASTGGAAAWPADKYLNIWVCNLGSGLLGYAQFPGGPARTDGVVILHSAFGTTGTVKQPFHLGRSATHEVGHWLNLRHIWADTMGCGGSDHVGDTPNATGPNYGKPAFPHVTCNNGPNGDMFVNYMDYVDDAAMFMFTTGQVGRMNATLAGPRKSFA
ncbi:MAG: zinc metalloprotease [Solirubrobacterales bacterium]